MLAFDILGNNVDFDMNTPMLGRVLVLLQKLENDLCSPAKDQFLLVKGELKGVLKVWLMQRDEAGAE